MIIEELTEGDFIKSFDDCNRGNNFSIKGRRALFEYFDELSTEENPFKLDVIAICCDFTEYEDIESYLNDYYTAEQKAQKISEFLVENNDLIEEWNTEHKQNKDSKEENEKKLFSWVIDLKEFDEWLQEDLNNETTLIKLGDSLNEGFILGVH